MEAETALTTAVAITQWGDTGCQGGWTGAGSHLLHFSRAEATTMTASAQLLFFFSASKANYTEKPICKFETDEQKPHMMH